MNKSGLIILNKSGLIIHEILSNLMRRLSSAGTFLKSNLIGNEKLLFMGEHHSVHLISYSVRFFFSYFGTILSIQVQQGLELHSFWFKIKKYIPALNNNIKSYLVFEQPRLFILPYFFADIIHRWSLTPNLNSTSGFFSSLSLGIAQLYCTFKTSQVLNAF